MLYPIPQNVFQEKSCKWVFGVDSDHFIQNTDACIDINAAEESGYDPIPDLGDDKIIDVLANSI